MTKVLEKYWRWTFFVAIFCWGILIGVNISQVDTRSDGSIERSVASASQSIKVSEKNDDDLRLINETWQVKAIKRKNDNFGSPEVLLDIQEGHFIAVKLVGENQVVIDQRPGNIYYIVSLNIDYPLSVGMRLETREFFLDLSREIKDVKTYNDFYWPYLNSRLHSDMDLDHTFMLYASCFNLDWRVLKAIAYAESDLKPKAGCKRKYKGLFQIDKNNCKIGIVPYSAYLSCNNLCDIETNTAVAAYQLHRSLERIYASCPMLDTKNQKLSKEEQVEAVKNTLLLVYVGHNNGPAVLKYLLKSKACQYDQMRRLIGSFYRRSRGGAINGVDAVWGLKKLDYGLKVVAVARRYEVSMVRLPQEQTNQALCPIIHNGMRKRH